MYPLHNSRCGYGVASRRRRTRPGLAPHLHRGRLWRWGYRVFLRVCYVARSNRVQRSAAAALPLRLGIPEKCSHDDILQGITSLF